MSELRFEWDPRKASANASKHEEEERFVLLGLSSSSRVLVVCHCYREEAHVIRIISARKATAREAKFYP